MKEETYSISEYVRNREIRIQLAIVFIIAAVGFALVIFLPGDETGIVNASASRFVDSQTLWAMMVMWGVMVLFHFVGSYLRYCRIAELGTELDRRIYAKDIRLLDHMEEGELCILENEINKLLSRLGEQNRELERDKRYLADSLTDLSHQLRTPLTSMNLICSMLETEEYPMEGFGMEEPFAENLSTEGLYKENPDMKKRTEQLCTMRSLLGKVQWLIDVLLKISKLDADAVTFEPQPCGLCELVEDAVEPLLIPLELADVRLVWEMGEDVMLCADRKWTMEAVVNIVKNCMEHTKEGGTITLSGRENAIYTELVISDNGAGIAKEDLPYLFERFYKGKDSRDESVGIGLALAKMIVVRQNGTIRAENGSSGGARFVIRIPKGY